MNLDEAQRQQVAVWMNQGLKLADIQAKLASEMGIRLTYMEVRFLVDDLKLVPKDPEPPKAATPAPAPADAAAAMAEDELPEEGLTEEPTEEAGATPGDGVSVTVDLLAKPGSVVSGSVTFSDGKTAAWYLDQTGRLGVAPQQQGYKPSPADVQAFQLALQRELQKLGF